MDRWSANARVASWLAEWNGHIYGNCLEIGLIGMGCALPSFEDVESTLKELQENMLESYKVIDFSEPYGSRSLAEYVEVWQRSENPEMFKETSCEVCQCGRTWYATSIEELFESYKKELINALQI